MSIEQALNPLRLLYKLDVSEQQYIKMLGVKYKTKNFLTPYELKWVIAKLTKSGIDFSKDNYHTKELTIELVPKTCWFTNVRSQVSKTSWDILRKDVYDKANNVCEICSGIGPKWPVECHEIWHYDDNEYIQKLVGLTALCPMCHEVKHIGLADKRGRLNIAKAHLAKVNDWDNHAVNNYLKNIWGIWKLRSSYSWKLDISYLGTLGISIEK